MQNRIRTVLTIIVVISAVILLSGMSRRQWIEDKCGDGICQKSEACNICPQDCKDPNIVCCKAKFPTDGRCADFDCIGDTNCPDNHPQVIRSGRFPKWSKAKNLIVFDDFVNEQGNSLGCNLSPLSCNYEIFTMKPDGSDVRCLTCNKPGLGNGHKGQPYWYPSGDYIVFTAENTDYLRWKDGDDLTVVPGICGRNNDVWIMTADGERFWRITNVPESGGIIRASFSPDGTMLYWNEEYSIDEHGQPSQWSVQRNPLGEKWGLWRIRIADIDLASGEPVMTNHRTVDINKLYSNKVLIEGQGIGPDNHLIFAAADTSETAGCCQWGWPGEEVFGYTHWSDIYTTDLNGNNLKRLTNTPYLHTENPEFSPDGKRIIFSETRWCVGKSGDIYLMNSDGSNRMRLTHLYNPNCPDYLGLYNGGAGDELDWSPDGEKITFSAITGSKIIYPYVEASIFILDVIN